MDRHFYISKNENFIAKSQTNTNTETNKLYKFSQNWLMDVLSNETHTNTETNKLYILKID